jgi:hypothetical protein
LPRRFFVYRRRRNFMAPPLQQFLQAAEMAGRFAPIE